MEIDYFDTAAFVSKSGHRRFVSAERKAQYYCLLSISVDSCRFDTKIGRPYTCVKEAG